MEILKKLIKDKKKMLLIIFALLVVIVLVVLLITMLGKGELIGGITNPDGKKIKNEYESLNAEVTEEGKNYPEVKLPSNNIMKYTTISEILNLFETNGDAVIYFGSSTCLYCRSAIQILCDVAAKTKLDTIYYLDDKDTDKNDSKYNDLLNKMGEEFITINDEKKELYIPLVIFVVNGDIVSYNKGTLFSQEDPYDELDDSQVNGLSEIYNYGIMDVLDSIKNKNKNNTNS